MNHHYTHEERKVSNGAKIRNRYNQVPHLTQDTNGKVKLSLQYAIRLAANPSNPAHEVTFPPNYVDLYEQKPKAIKSFGIRVSPLIVSANIKQQNIKKNILHQIFQLGV